MEERPAIWRVAANILHKQSRTADKGYLDKRKQAKMHWVQDPSQSNVDSLNNVRREASRHFRNKRKEYLKPKIEELTVRSRLLGTCIGASVTLRGVTSLELM